MYTVVKQPKSIGIALLLTFLFGPIGLFYASVTGGLVMTLGPLALLIFLIVTIQNSAAVLAFLISMVIYALIGWLICLIWAVIAINSYNRKLMLGSVVGTIINSATSSVNNADQSSSNYEPVNGNIQENKKFKLVTASVVILLLSIIAFLLFDRNQLKDRNKLETVAQNEHSVYSSPNVKSKIVAAVQEDDLVDVVSETVYFIKVKLTQKNGNIVYGFIRKSFINQNEKIRNSENIIEAKDLEAPFSMRSMIDHVKDIPRSANLIISTADSESLTDVEEGSWRVISSKAYFYQSADVKSPKEGYLIKGDVVSSKLGSDNFIHAVYVNTRGVTTAGFILRKNLVLENSKVTPQDSLR